MVKQEQLGSVDDSERLALGAAQRMASMQLAQQRRAEKAALEAQAEQEDEEDEEPDFEVDAPQRLALPPAD